MCVKCDRVADLMKKLRVRQAQVEEQRRRVGTGKEPPPRQYAFGFLISGGETDFDRGRVFGQSETLDSVVAQLEGAIFNLDEELPAS